MRSPRFATTTLAVIVLAGALALGLMGGGSEPAAEPVGETLEPDQATTLPHADDDVPDDAPFGHHRRTQVQRCKADPDCEKPGPAHMHSRHPGGGPPDHAGPPER